ncbi:CD99 antigen-like protein 2 isoform 2-T2 [Anableps anableps]
MRVILNYRSVWALCVLALLHPLRVLSQIDFNLADALDDDSKPSGPVTPRPETQTRGTEQGISLETARTTTTKASAKLPSSTAVSGKTKSKSTGEDFDLADALDKNQKPRGAFSDSDLEGVSKDNTYNPDKGKGGHQRSDTNQSTHDENSEITAEVGTIAGIISAVGMALVGALSSYITYQKKKLCFSIQAQQTLLEQPRSGPPYDENAV